jgi:site-specific DNA recombinase
VNEDKEACNAKAVDEHILQDAFIRVFNRLKEDKGSFTDTLNANIEKVLSQRAGNGALIDIEKNIEQLKEDLKALVKLKLRDNIDETVYNEESARISKELEELRNRKLKITKEYEQQEQYKERIKEIIHTINEREGLLEQFDDDIFNALVEKITILSPTHFCFVLKSGLVIEEFEE